MAEQSEPKKTKNAPGGDSAEAITSPERAYALENAFPDPSAMFLPYAEARATDENVLIALDANTLLVPYRLDAKGLRSLGDIYKKLAAENRLYVPARAAREFAKNRGGRLSEWLYSLSKRDQQLPDPRLPLFLEGTSEYEDVSARYGQLRKARTEYKVALDRLIGQLKNWRADDPVSALYAELFVGTKVVEEWDSPDARKQTLEEWGVRIRTKRPPGYKDGGKGPDAIGDFLVWKSCLRLAQQHAKDLILVTSDQKADWFVRSDGDGIYPRPELIDEYRLHSNGHTLRMIGLYELLEEMEVDKTIISEVREVEREANTAAPSVYASRYFGNGQMGSRRFDYSTNEGVISVAANTAKFTFRFSKGPDGALYLQKVAPVTGIARAPGGGSTRQTAMFDDFDWTSDVCPVEVGDNFLARNEFGASLIGKIDGIKSTERGDGSDEVDFTFKIGPVENTIHLY